MISGLFSLLGAAVLVVIDQLIKHWATAALLPAWHFGALEGFALVLAADVLMIQRHHRGIARALRGEERRALRGKTAREK